MRTAGVLLIGGALAFLTGAAIPVRWLEVWFASTERHLEVVRTHASAWRWLNGLMIAAVVLTAAGLGALGHVIGNPAAAAGATAYAGAAVIWIVFSAYRATLSPRVGDRLAATGALPDWYQDVSDTAGALFTIYIVIAFAAEAIVGVGLLRAGAVPEWIGWFTVGFGLVGGASQLFPFSRIPVLAGIFQVPILVHVAPLLIGIAVLRLPA